MGKTVDWHEWKSMVAYKCPLCNKYYAKPWSHLCKKDTSLIQCGKCKYHYIAELTSGGYGEECDPPETVGHYHACRKWHSNNTPRMRECRDYEETLEKNLIDMPEAEIDKYIDEQNKKWKI
jgi:uncharacterized CHY-type Zn-finger protein